MKLVLESDKQNSNQTLEGGGHNTINEAYEISWFLSTHKHNASRAKCRHLLLQVKLNDTISLDPCSIHVGVLCNVCV